MNILKITNVVKTILLRLGVEKIAQGYKTVIVELTLEPVSRDSWSTL